MSCNHHCFAQGAEDGVPIDEDTYVHARKPNGMPWCFAVEANGLPWSRNAQVVPSSWDDPEAARQAWLTRDENDPDVEDDSDESDEGDEP